MSLFQRTKRWLRRQYPCPLPITVRVVPATDELMEGVSGWFVAAQDGEWSIIYISRTNDGHMAETLIEEWCHALRHVCPIPVDYDGEPHDMLFWVIYGEVTNHWRSRLLVNR